MICKNCGVLLGEGHEVCPRCGARLASQEERTPTRHEKSPWKGPARRVSTLPSEPQRPDPREQPQQTSQHEQAPEVEGRHTHASQSAPRHVQQPQSRADERPSTRRQQKPDEPLAASRPEKPRPLSQLSNGAEGVPEEKIRMVRRHKYKAIEPEYSDYANLNWIRLFAVTVVSVLIIASGIYFFLAHTLPGTVFCARMGWDTTAEAYLELGSEYMSSGSISRAVNALEIAQTKNPQDLETLIDLGRAYTGANMPERAELAYMYAIECWPAYPESYRYLVEILLDTGRNYEALECIDLAIENTEDSYFTTLLRQIKPATPTVSVLGGSFAEEFELSISAEEGAKIYYTLLGEDPQEDGTLYSEPIYLAEGSWKLQAVASKDGMFSDINSQTYIINKPNPDAPKATLQSGEYSSVRTVSLRCGDDVVAMYYTMDGTAPTTESTLYQGPITLRIGKTTLRAIAVNAEGKKSNEMVVEYECGGNAGTSFKDSDVIDKLSLNNTTQESFISTYGEPNSQQDDGRDELGNYTRLNYAWGFATFLDRNNDKSPVLVELSTSTSEMKGPRSTGIGMRVEDVLSAFRDVGGEENTQGIRNLYTLTTTTSSAIGILTRIDEDDFHIGYYYKVATDTWVELSYYSEGGLIVRMEWRWYMSA